jgi:hypothetical protein
MKIENKPSLGHGFRKMKDRQGDEYLVKFGEKLKPTKPEITKIIKSADATEYKISASTPKQVKTLLGKIKKDHPEINLDIDTVVKELKYKESQLDGMLHQRLNLGPNIFWPASFVMASIYAVSKGMPAHPKFKEFVDDFEPTTLSSDVDPIDKNAAIPPDTFYWVQQTEWFKVSVDISHVLLLFCDSKRKESIFYVELFNLPGVAVILPYDGDTDAVFTNGIDVITGDKTEVIFDSCAFKSLKWESTHPWEIGKLDEFFSIAKQKVERVIRVAHERSERHEIDRLLKEKIEDFDGNHVSSPEVRKQIIDVITAYHTRKLLNMFESEMYDEKLNTISDKNP